MSRDSSGNLIVSHSAADADRLGSIARQVGTRKELSSAQIEAQVSAGLRTAKTEAPVQIASIRGAKGKTVDFRSLGPDESLYHSRTLAPEEQKILGELAGAKQEAIVLEQRPNGKLRPDPHRLARGAGSGLDYCRNGRACERTSRAPPADATVFRC